ncbi:unnamed protein product [Fusarium venenatum]|uniref:Autophagy-related protein 1 n=1 Tax=Fusarium venenatum TaxID=56646 RepID=A0A2L2TLL3_9HYPO|nr:uncharacterized protein FVRRES_00598 [Fusarium venenatum]KAH7006164.1 hypothetical protein EDB82DRAFT_458710 [Fusarium venenatum]CEI64086.1 unnamed protein product [Fusarium venenatum]
MDGDEPTQATQNVLDPRRIGKQNSGFSDEDISDIICVLYPHSESARIELERLVKEGSPHIIGKDEADGVEPDYALEDQAGRFSANTGSSGSHAIILRLSSQLKNPAAGFVFGRNTMRCDVVFVNDPLKRVSNIHFRIYVNEYGTVMIEDQSTNGTIVDDHILASNPSAKRDDPPITKWVLSSGSIIKVYLHQAERDLTFRVRIPRRDNEYDQAYTEKVDDFFTRHGIKRSNDTITPGPGGHVDLFKVPAQNQFKREETDEITQQASRKPQKRRDGNGNREWTGSKKYNRIGTIGKGAFAIVHRVTSKYDGLPYAAKEIEKRRFIKNGVLDQKVENEMKIMQRVEHPHIVQYMEHFEWDDRLLIIIMEFVPGGDLGKLISDHKALTEESVRIMSKQLLSALGYLHDNNITHRDVKPDNILINSLNPIDLKLTDFGLSKMVDSEQTFLRTFCGTLLYCAPEVYTEYAEYDDNGVRSRGKKMRRPPGQRYNHAVDIWSLGGVLFYALTASPPYPVKSGISYSELLHKIMTTRLDTSPLERNGLKEPVIEFLCRMLEKRPEYRATVTELEHHPWFTGESSVISASQSFDEISDDDMYDNFSQLQPRHYEEDRVSDSMGEESEKEITAGLPDANKPRLFGEVGVSAIGSSGVIPGEYLNLEASNASTGETEILNQDEDEAYQSDEDATPRGRNRRAYRQTTASMVQKQSEDQLQSLVENVASQSLGGDEPSMQFLGASQFSLQSSDLNTSKRKPPSQDTSDEFEESTPRGKPTMKRLKSEGNLEEMTKEALEEYQLLIQVPVAGKPSSGRQIDQPFNKTCFWEQDKKTWHFNYPELTHLQHKAFEQAAKTRGETFAPGKTPLWDLAMKYFSPVSKAGTQISETRRSSRTPQGTTDDAMEFPPTAVASEDSQIPDTLPTSHTQIVVPVQKPEPNKQLVGVIESHPESCIPGITIPITDTLVSFGRGPSNTEPFSDIYESRVPKYAFKILLWKDDDTFDPSKMPFPWLRNGEDPNAYSFYVSTKASVGININGYQLASADAKNHGGPSHHWTRLYNGDTLTIWGSGDRSSQQTKLNFQCLWGASTQERGENKALELAQKPMAQKLDAACQKTEKRIKDAVERKKKEDAISADLQERAENIDRERARSDAFEMKRQEAIAYFESRQSPLSRMAAITSAPLTSHFLGIPLPRPNPSQENSFQIQ